MILSVNAVPFNLISDAPPPDPAIEISPEPDLPPPLTLKRQMLSELRAQGSENREKDSSGLPHSVTAKKRLKPSEEFLKC